MFSNLEDILLRIFFWAHWSIPWLILVIGLYAIVKFVRGYMNEDTFTDRDRRLVSVFSGLLDLQGLIGLIYFFWTGFTTDTFPAYRIFHAITMLAAAIIPHFSPIWRDEKDATRFINNFYLLLASFLLMLVGISFIPA
jgi:hypothetical protein